MSTFTGIVTKENWCLAVWPAHWKASPVAKVRILDATWWKPVKAPFLSSSCIVNTCGDSVCSHCFAFVCIARTDTGAHVKDPMSTFP